MSIDEMKLAVVTLIPEHIFIEDRDEYYFRWKDRRDGKPLDYVGQREWPYVCLLVLKKLGLMIRMQVHARLTNNMRCPVTGYAPPVSDVAFTPVDELLKAICQVEFPHLFEQPPVSTFHKTTT